jgi:hypothetical protein
LRRGSSARNPAQTKLIRTGSPAISLGQNAGNIPKAYVSTKEGYQEGKKQVEASGYDKGVEEGKQTSQKKVASLLARAERLQLEFAYESMASQNFKLRLDNLAAENRRLRHQLSLESPREDDGAGSG